MGLRPRPTPTTATADAHRELLTQALIAAIDLASAYAADGEVRKVRMCKRAIDTFQRELMAPASGPRPGVAVPFRPDHH